MLSRKRLFTYCDCLKKKLTHATNNVTTNATYFFKFSILQVIDGMIRNTINRFSTKDVFTITIRIRKWTCDLFVVCVSRVVVLQSSWKMKQSHDVNSVTNEYPRRPLIEVEWMSHNKSSIMFFFDSVAPYSMWLCRCSTISETWISAIFLRYGLFQE